MRCPHQRRLHIIRAALACRFHLPSDPTECGLEQTGRFRGGAARVQNGPAEMVSVGLVADGADPSVVVLTGRSAADYRVAGIQSRCSTFSEPGAAELAAAGYPRGVPGAVALPHEAGADQPGVLMVEQFDGRPAARADRDCSIGEELHLAHRALRATNRVVASRKISARS